MSEDERKGIEMQGFMSDWETLGAKYEFCLIHKLVY